MPDGCLFTLRLWIGQVSLTGRHAAPRTSPYTPRTLSPDRARVLRSMHRLAWTRVEAGLDESRSTSSIMMLAMER